MSGSLSFISANPAGDAFNRQAEAQDRQWARDEERRRAAEERSVDAAVRQGLSSVTAGRPAAVQPQPQQQPAPQPPAGPTPLVSPNDRQSFWNSVGRTEDPSGRAINAGGYTGRYQFGTAALTSAGMYQPAPGENVSKNEWRGSVVLPDGRRLTQQEFANDQGAQEIAKGGHEKNLDREIAARGLDRYVGTTVMGQPVTRQMLYSLMHFGGPQGAENYLKSGGIADPADANGTRMSQYYGRVMGNGGGSAPAGMPSLSPGTSARMPTSSVDYNPMLTSLARTPGGGRVALGVLDKIAAQDERNTTRGDRLDQRDTTTRQWDTNRRDRLDQRDITRKDQFQKLAMEAYGKGDMEVGDYYAGAGGIQIPPELRANAGQMKKLGEAATLSTRIYGTDKAGGARFIQGFLQTGDVGTAIESAGAPVVQGRRMQVQWVDNGDGRATGVMIDPTNPSAPAVPLLDANGQQVVRAPGVGQQGRTADRDLKFRYARQAGLSEQEAAAVAAGVVPSASSMVGAYSALQRSVGRDYSIDDKDKPARVQDGMEAIFGPGWQSRMQGRPSGGGGGIPAPTAAPTVAPPQAAPAPAMARPPSVPAGSQYSPSRRMWRDPTGRMYDETGTPQ